VAEMLRLLFLIALVRLCKLLEKRYNFISSPDLQSNLFLTPDLIKAIGFSYFRVRLGKGFWLVCLK
jgi:hypothetical protein